MTLIERDSEVPFRELLFDLVRMGWTLNGIAASINVPPSTVKGWWYDSAQPLYESGRALVKFYNLERKKNGLTTLEA